MAKSTVTADPGTGGADFETDLITAVHTPVTKISLGAFGISTLASSGNGTTDAGTQRVTLASDGTGQVALATGSATVGEVTMGAASTAAGDLAKAEDAVHGSGDVGVMTLGVRNDALATLADTDGDYAPLQVDADGALYTKHSNTISTNNSSTSTLTSASTFTGTGDDVSSFASVTVQVDASHDSATDGMTFQFSTDNSNWDDVYLFTYTAADNARRFQFPVTGQFFRVVYTNGGTGQTHFRLQTILHSNAGLTSIHRLVDSVDPDRSAQLSKSVIIAQAAGSGDFVPVQATAGGNLKVAIEEFDTSLPAGTNNIGDVDVLTQPARVATTDNMGAAIQTNQMMDGTTSLTPKFAVIDDALSGDNTIIAAVASKKIRVLQITLIATAAVNVRFESGAAGTALTGQMALTANSGFEASFCPVGHFETAVNTLLNLELSAAVSVDGWLVYVEV